MVHAHPDDEVFATGAAVIALSDAGWRVVLRVATGGEASEDAGLGEAEARRVRGEKLSQSCALLGIAEWGWLGEAGEWVDRGGAGAGSVAAAESAILVQAVRRALVDVRPELVLSVGRDGLTGHPDHVAIGTAVREATDGTALGARLRAADVVAGREAVEKLAGRPVGSGRVVGAGDDVALEEIRAGGEKESAGQESVGVESAGRESGHSAEQRRRQALDVYRPGLGTAPIEELLTGRLGDSVLLRAVLDVAGWNKDLFERL
ncbi:PIG-L family deacetylase [Kribbella sp. NPDC051770]|uniref:PIG-L deacetylase family protein n=1 Tax=Kribbella sp. NPDC051770 TaxID=3155413 RepID=UPI003421C2FD